MPFVGNFMKIGAKPHGMERNALNVEKLQVITTGKCLFIFSN